MAPDNCRYTKDHEWIRVEGDTGVVGITDHAAKKLGDVTFIEYAITTGEVKAGDVVVTVESVKAASEVYAPVGGTVSEVNPRLENEPELVNDSPFADGWLVKITLADASAAEGLMDATAYGEYVEGLEE